MNAAEIVPSTVQIRAPQPLTRMRFAHQCVSELRKLDPSCPITETFIRSLVKRGLVASVSVGRRRLVNFDDLLRYLSCTPIEPPSAPSPAGIRRIAE